MSGRIDPIRARHAVLLASVVGLRGASKQTGVSPSRISEWRTMIERKTGERFPRRIDLRGRRRPFPLTDEQCEAIHKRRIERGTSWRRLAMIYGVSPSTAVRAAKRIRNKA